MKEYFKHIEDLNQTFSKIKKNIPHGHTNLKNVKSDINELKSQVSLIEESIDKLENVEGYEIIKDELIELENLIEKNRIKKITLEEQIIKLEPISHKVNIKTDEISEFYELLKEGLGSLITKDLNEVIHFKKKIDDFQNYLLTEKKRELLEQISIYNKEINELDSKYKKNLQVLDKEGGLKNLKQTYTAFKDKSDQLYRLDNWYSDYESTESDIQKYKSKKEIKLIELQSDIDSKKNSINNFEETILNIHDFIQGNKKASFGIKTVKTKQIIQIDLRIDNDGSHSIERVKVFMYDISLLLNYFTQLNHPGFLIHDNIFEVDKDTFEKSIKFLEEKAIFSDKQYILTLNADLLDSNSLNKDVILKNKINSHIKATFTKQKRFLKKKYQEKI